MAADRQREALRELKRMSDHGFDGLHPGGGVRKAVLVACESRGWAKRVDGLIRCDGDGFTLHPEREGTGWAITPEGLQALEFMDRLAPHTANRNESAYRAKQARRL